MDGASRKYVEEAVDRGLMPNMEKMIEKGAFGDMDSVVPPITLPAWPCMFSGRTPDRFDTFNLMSMDEDYSIGATERSWKGDLVWDRIDGSFGVLSVPGTSGWPLNGYMIGGFPLTGGSVYPEDLLEEVEEPEFVNVGSLPTRKERRKAEFENFEKELDLFGSINRDVDVKIEVYQLTDNAAHRSKSVDEILELYEKADRVLGEKIEEYEDILVVSDHGFTHVDRYFYINTWLKENGYLEEKESSGRSLRQLVQKLVTPLAETSLRPFLKKANDILQNSTGADFGFNADSPENIDYSSTEAFCFQGSSSHYGGIWINDERWSSPVVDDREEKATEVKQELEEVDVVENAWLRENIYDEPGGMPDIVFKTVADTGIGVSLFPKTLVKTDAYIHELTGIVAATGESFSSGEVEDAEIIDVAPTIARYLGQELECDGEPLEIFREGFEPRKPSGDEIGGIDF